MDKWIEEAAAACDNLLSHRGLKREFAAIIQRHYEKASKCRMCNGYGERIFHGGDGIGDRFQLCSMCGGNGRIVP